ncbi:MAG: insulinase family protein [Bacteroidota bacterium]|nr:insulinase family protein [Bacteroidota bacterium]MDP4193652.1 insulinase family protein [Bacteroidota bacterium]
MNALKLILSLASVLAIAWSIVLPMGGEDYKKGETYHGFKLLEKKFVKEVNAECLLFEHIKSGARLLKINAKDPNKTFSVAFKTIPESDGGTPHIIEHSVLNGSTHFPVKSPFDVLSKGSLNTFLNAMTGSDITIYPVASMNDKDYFNLMHIYLDAVFNPLIYKNPRIFQQEGWHYETDDSTGEISYKGVVYNEMKGAYSSPERELGYQTQKNLFPDNAYKFSSGGYPTSIPKLRYQDFLNFHKKYYHPSNSYIYLYGDYDLDKELEFIDKEYLSNYTKEDVLAKIPLQKPFDKMKEVKAFYPVAETDKTEDQTFLTLSFVAGLNTDRTLVLALNTLSDVLVNQEAAPIRLALKEAGIGQDVSAWVDDIQQNVFQIKVQNANPADKEKFLQIVMNTLKNVADKGLDKKAVEGSLNRTEFHLREGDDAQKGLTYNFQAVTTWFFAANPFIGLEYEKTLSALKSGIGNRFLEETIKKYMIENPHSLLLVLEPKAGLEKENNAKIDSELKEYKNSLSKNDLEALSKQTKDLINYQKSEDTPEALATIPMLERKDINPKAEWYDIKEEKVSDIPLLFHEDFTNDVVYSKFMFDLRTLPEELIPYAALLSEVLGSQNTEHYSYGELDKELNLHTGGFNTYLNVFLENRQDENMLPKFVVDSKVMNTKVDKMFELVDEIISKTKFSDIERLKTILTRFQSRLESQVKQNGYNYTQMRLASYFSKSGMFNESTRGIEYYWFITDLANNFDQKAKDISENLQKTASLLFNRNNLVAALTSGKNDLDGYKKQLEKFVSTLPENKIELKSWKLDPKKKNEGIQTASKVQYVLQGFNFKKLGYQWNGKMRVLEQILSTDWLQTRVRVIGGAYGGFCSFSPMGTVYFASYRDPNLKETLDNFAGSPEFLDKLSADEKTMTRFIIGTIASMDSPLTPSDKGNVAVRRYFEKVTNNILQKERDEVLSTNLEDIKAMKKLVGDILSQKIYCVYGNEEKIQSEKDLFINLVKLNKQVQQDVSKSNPKK